MWEQPTKRATTPLSINKNPPRKIPYKVFSDCVFGGNAYTKPKPASRLQIPAIQSAAEPSCVAFRKMTDGTNAKIVEMIASAVRNFGFMDLSVRHRLQPAVMPTTKLNMNTAAPSK